MTSKSHASSRSCGGNENGEGVANKQLGEKVELGDMIWVKIDGDLWWPAQVVDENNVSGGNKPNNKSVGDVLVRLYGSYQYLYADPVKCHSDFETVLKQNGGSYREVFKKSLEQDCNCLKSGRGKGHGSKSAGASSAGKTRPQKTDEPTKNKTPNQGSKRSSRSAKEEAKGKIHEQAQVQKKVKSGNPSIGEGRGHKFSKPDEEQNISTPNFMSPEKGRTNGIFKQEQCKFNSPISGMTSSGKFDELSARKERVKRELGLIPPEGSPFQKYEDTSSSDGDSADNDITILC